MSITNIKIEKYSDKSYVVTGDTIKYKEPLRLLGCKYNSRLKCGPGWIFPSSMLETVEDYFSLTSKKPSCITQSIISNSQVDILQEIKHIKNTMNSLNTKLDLLISKLEQNSSGNKVRTTSGNKVRNSSDNKVKNSTPTMKRLLR